MGLSRPNAWSTTRTLVLDPESPGTAGRHCVHSDPVPGDSGQGRSARSVAQLSRETRDLV